MTRTPRLAVCIPAYNQPAFLREALTSLCDQDLDRNDYVVAVADDASPTPLETVINEFGDRLTIVYHRQAQNVGHLANWDASWQLADAPLISFLAHDDVVAPGHFARALTAMAAHDDVVLLSSLVICQGSPGALNAHARGIFPRARSQSSFTRPYQWDRAEWQALSLVSTPSSMVGSVFRTEVFRTCREWVSYPIWHDRLMLAEMGLHGDVLTLPWIAGSYRTGDWQLSGQIWQPDMSEFDRATAAVRRWCATNAIDVIGFWIDHICAAVPAERVMFLQMVRTALPRAEFEAIKQECESRLNTRLPLGRLERLGIPAPIAELVRTFDRKVLSRR